MRNYLYLFFSFIFLLHIFTEFYTNNILIYILGILSFIMLIISFPLANRLFKILGSAFLIAGFFLFITTDIQTRNIPPLLGTNLSLLTLLAVLPWMNSVVRAGRFDTLMQKLLRGNVKDLGSLYQRSTTAMMSLTAFLNVSAATIAQDVLVDNLKPIKKDVADKFVMMATLRGYSLALLWSPLEVLIALSIFITGVQFGELLPWVLGITIFMYIVDSIWGRIYFGKYKYPASRMGNNKLTSHSKKKIAQLALALITFLACVILIGNIFDYEFIFVVTMLVFPFAFIWALLIGRMKSFWVIGWDKFKHTTNNMHNFIVLFVTLAFFANSLNASPAQTIIQQPILMVADYPVVILIMVQLLFVFMSMFGIHPIATIGILGGLSTLLLEILNPLSLAIILTTSGVATVPIGTYGLVVTLTSMNLKKSPYKITYYNLIYSTIFGAVGIFVAWLAL